MSARVRIRNVRLKQTGKPLVEMKIAPAVLAASQAKRGQGARSAWTIPKPPPGMLPDGAKTMAMDEDISAAYAWAGGYGLSSEGLAFVGYPYLAELTQRPEYRRGSEIIAKEMTRKWIKLVASGDDDKTETLAAIDAEMKRLKVQDAFRRAAEQDGFFGRSQIYLDTGASENPNELMTPLAVSKAKIGRGGLKRLVVIEPIWTYPAAYNSSDPLAADFYKPQAWYVMGKQVHASRLLTFVSREMPDLLKPAYMFGGVSLSQMGKPYVDRWLRAVGSVSDLIETFSTMVLATDLNAALAGAGGMGMLDRIALFNNVRHNAGTMAINKETELLTNVAVPLGTLDHLQAQSQEHMSSVWGIPLIVFFGITPSGLNTSTDGEMNVWEITVNAMQQHLFGSNLDRLLPIIQLSLFGEIDPDIGYVWEKLGQTDETAAAAIRKSDADVAIEYIGAGVLAPEEERTRLAAAEDSLYPGLDVADLPDVAGDPDDGTEEGGEPTGDMLPFGGAADGEFNEGDHPRDDDGKFGNGGNSAGGDDPVALTGTELGPWSGMRDLRKKALAFASRFIGKTFTNKATGNAILVPKSGVDHTISRAGDTLVRTIPAIPDLLERGRLIGAEPDKRGDPNIVIEKYSAPLIVEGRRYNAILTVKSFKDGRRYYDHGILEVRPPQ